MVGFIFLSVVAAFVVLVIMLIFLNRAPALVAGLPHPPRVPILGNFLCLPMPIHGVNVYEWYRDWTEKLGDTWTFAMFGQQQPSLMTTSPAIIEHILKTNFDNYVKGKQFTTRLGDLLGDGIFNTDGENWYRQRKVSSHIFSINNFKLTMMDVFLQHGKTFVHILNSVKTGQVIDMQNLFFRYTLTSFCQIGFGVDIKAMEQTPPFAQCFDFVQQQCALRFRTPLWWLWELFGEKGKEVRKSLKTIDQVAYDLIKERRSSAKPSDRDLMGLFLSQKDLNGQPFSDEFLRDIILNFLLAGRDTTANALSWLLWELAANPDVEEKVLQEIRAVIGSGEPTYDNVQHLTYTQAVISESLRLHPSIPHDVKTALQDDELPGGIKIKKGTSVVYLIYVMNRDPKRWPNPLKFDPERFVQAPIASLSPFEFPVFNAGPRTCLGKNFAFVEMKTILSLLIPRFKFAVSGPTATHTSPVFPSLTLSILGGLPVTVTPREIV